MEPTPEEVMGTAQSYAACSLRYFDGDGRRFIIPPGTHCDIISHGTINPGQTKPLFN